MHDRAEGESLTYTHEFLANMLGANRKSVMLAVPRVLVLAARGVPETTIMINIAPTRFQRGP